MPDSANAFSNGCVDQQVSLKLVSSSFICSGQSPDKEWIWLYQSALPHEILIKIHFIVKPKKELNRVWSNF